METKATDALVILELYDYLMHLERLVLKVPNIEKKLDNRRRLLERWLKTAAPN